MSEEVIIEIEKIRVHCLELSIQLVRTDSISEEDLAIISKRSEDSSSLYFVDTPLLKERLSNGCILLIKDDEIIGHIFAHKHMLGRHAIYERCTLWVKPEYRQYNLGLLLMSELTQDLADGYVVSIAKAPKVHFYNECLGMDKIALAAISPALIDTLEEIGKLRDEKSYKYYVNARLHKALRRLK